MDIRIIWGNEIPYDGILSPEGEASLCAARKFNLDQICKKVFVDLDMYTTSSPKTGGVSCTIFFDRGLIEDTTEGMRDTIEWRDIELKWRTSARLIEGTVSVSCKNGISTEVIGSFESQNLLRLLENYRATLSDIFKDKDVVKVLMDFIDIWHKRIS